MLSFPTARPVGHVTRGLMMTGKGATKPKQIGVRHHRQSIEKAYLRSVVPGKGSGVVPGKGSIRRTVRGLSGCERGREGGPARVRLRG